jgi:hypothetical protein
MSRVAVAVPSKVLLSATIPPTLNGLGATAKDLVVVAAFQLGSAGWVATRVHVPAALNVTAVPVTEQTLQLLGSAVTVVGRPLVADAATAPGAPP